MGESKRNEAFLLRGSDLTAAESWLAAAATQKDMRPTPLHVEYITASRRGATKRLRVLLASVGFAALVAIVLALLAFRESRLAKQGRELAEQRKVEADSNADRADVNAVQSEKNATEARNNAIVAESRRKEAEEQRRTAVEQRDAALSRELATDSLMTQSTDPELSLLLAQRAARVRKTDQAEQTLRQSIVFPV